MSFTDSGLASGITYYFKVKATSSSGSSVLSAAVPGTTVNSGPVDLLPGIITFSGNSVPGGGSLPVSLPIVNNGSGAVTQSFVVNFYSALTGTFAPLTDTLVGSATVSSGVGSNSSTMANSTLTIPALGMNQTYSFMPLRMRGR
jgi:hypothetical protein